jgi:hypothetical protein
VVISGADINGNGIFDAITVKPANSKLLWSIKSDLFSKNINNGILPNTQEITFGRASDFPFFVNLFGTGDNLAVFSKVRNRAIATLRDLNTGKKRRVRFDRFALSSSSPEPFLTQDGTDGFLFVKDTKYKIYNRNGRVLANGTFPFSGIVVHGNFLESLGEELAIRNGDNGVIYIVNPFTKIENTIDAPAGILVDEININDFSEEPENENDQELQEPVDNRFYPVPGTPNGICEVRKTQDGGGVGFRFKPRSETTGSLAVLLPEEVRYYHVKDNKLEILANGEVVNTLDNVKTALKSLGPRYANGNRSHWWDNNYSTGYYRKFGTITVRVNFTNGACWDYIITQPGNDYE